MEANLDCLFADLVKLSNMYEIEEGKAEKFRVRNEELAENLKTERRKREESERAAKTENERLQSETEKLEKKLGKYREKVEEYRRERAEREQKQRSSGPVSYINNLHDSMNASSAHSSRHNRSSATQKKTSTSKGHIYGRGKENGYANGSQRRARTGDEHSSSSAYRSRSHR